MTDPFDSLMINSCTILRRGTGGEDDSGHNLADYEAIHSSVACRIYESTGTEHKVGDELTIAHSKVAMRPIGVIEQDALEINGRGYNVLHVYEVRALENTPHHLELSVEELKNVASEFLQLNLRTEAAKKEAADAIYAGVRQIFQDKIKPEAERRSPKSEVLKKGETIHNADSIKVRGRKTKNGPKFTIFTTSGHGGFLEKGTSKMPAHPYLYPAYLLYAGSLPGTIKEKLKLVPSSK